MAGQHLRMAPGQQVTDPAGHDADGKRHHPLPLFGDQKDVDQGKGKYDRRAAVHAAGGEERERINRKIKEAGYCRTSPHMSGPEGKGYGSGKEKRAEQHDADMQQIAALHHLIDGYDHKLRQRNGGKKLEKPQAQRHLGIQKAIQDSFHPAHPAVCSSPRSFSVRDRYSVRKRS